MKNMRGVGLLVCLCAFGVLSLSGCGDDDDTPVDAGGGSGGDGGTGGGSDDAGGDASRDATQDDADVNDGAIDDAATDAGLDAAVPRPEFEALFDPTLMPTFEITIPQASWEALELDDSEYQPGTLRFGDITLENVGIRLKGRASRRPLSDKPGFKIKVNEFVPGQRLLGLKRITLNNLVQDPTMARERLAYTVFRAMGVPAPLANHARVIVNGTYYGVYLNLQSLDEVFVGSHWSPAPGNLYDISNTTYHVDFEREMPGDPATELKFELETNKTVNDTSDLTALIDAVSSQPEEQVIARVEALMNLDEVLTLGAVQAIIADWDGYFGARNNYKLYHELSDDRFVMLPWGTDQSFGTQADESNADVHTWYTMLDYEIFHSSSGRTRSLIIDHCTHNLVCGARYVALVEQALAVFEGAQLEDELDRILLQISDAVDDDTKQPFDADQRAASIADLRDFLAQRAMRVQEQLDALP